MNQVIKKICNTLIDVIIILILIISVAVVVMAITSKDTGVPNVFGYAPLSVQTDSMTPTIEENDLIFGKIFTTETNDLQVGDVITFPIEIEGKSYLNTHRIVAVEKDDNITYYQTQGDKEGAPIDEKMQTGATVVAKWTGVRIPGVGGFLTFIRTQLGFFLVILLPMILFFVYQAIRVILNIIAYNKEKASEEAAAVVANAELTEEQKQRAIAEYLAQQKLKEESEPTVQTPAEGDQSEADSEE